jgi:hypothetical protein
LLRRGRLGRDSSGHAGLGAQSRTKRSCPRWRWTRPRVFRTEVMCQNVPSLDEPVSPLAWSSYADPGPDHQGRRAPSLITSRIPVRPECVTQCRGLIRWSRRENRTGSAPRPAGSDCRRYNISVAFGLSYNRPSGGRRPLRKKQRNAESHPGLRSPTARCDDCSE